MALSCRTGKRLGAIVLVCPEYVGMDRQRCSGRCLPLATGSFDSVDLLHDNIFIVKSRSFPVMRIFGSISIMKRSDCQSLNIRRRRPFRQFSWLHVHGARSFEYMELLFTINLFENYGEQR